MAILQHAPRRVGGVRDPRARAAPGERRAADAPAGNRGCVPVKTSAVATDAGREVCATTPQSTTAVGRSARRRTQDWARASAPGGDRTTVRAWEGNMSQGGARPATAWGTVRRQPRAGSRADVGTPRA